MLKKIRGERVMKWRLPPKRLSVLLEALCMYGDPESYHAMSFMGDRPCGAFADDFGTEHGDEFYGRDMPGKTARNALRYWYGQPVEEE